MKKFLAYLAIGLSGLITIATVSLLMSEDPLKSLESVAVRHADKLPLEYFGELAAALSGQGVAVVVLGSKGEHAVGEQIRQAGGEGLFQPGGIQRQAGAQVVKAGWGETEAKAGGYLAT